jgi:hypothetical protein
MRLSPVSRSHWASTHRAHSPQRKRSDRAAEAGFCGGLALGIFGARADKDNVCTVGKMQRERFGQRKRFEMVGRERHVPALRVVCGAQLVDARVVEQAGDRKMERDDLCGRASDARRIRQVAHDRNRVLPFSLDRLLHFVELLAVPANQHDSAVLGQLKCRAATYAGGRAGDDVRFAISHPESVELRDLRLAIITSQHRSLRPGCGSDQYIRQSTLSHRLRDLEYRLGRHFI